MNNENAEAAVQPIMRVVRKPATFYLFCTSYPETKYTANSIFSLRFNYVLE